MRQRATAANPTRTRAPWAWGGLGLVGLMLAALCGLPQAAHAQAVAAVSLAQGRLAGRTEQGVESFKGVPYAAAPVGPLRWRAPQTAPAWTGVRDASAFSGVCPQADVSGEPYRTPPVQTEDCLYLNVWRPVAAKAGLPVMVWIHGGGFVNGAASVPTYDGAAFARRGVVLVSINYRLGHLGFFAHRALSKENADGGHLGDYGLMDQIAALKWVRANIAGFGGDPRKVTVFGESAGAASVDALMTAPDARGLFRAAIVESGYERGERVRLDRATNQGKPSAESDGTSFAQALGAADARDLRALPLATIQAKPSYPMNFGLIQDGKVLDKDLFASFRAGQEAPVPLLIGSNSLEFDARDAKQSAIVDKVISAYVPHDARAGLAKAYGGQAVLDRHLQSDVIFGEQARSLALLHRKNGYPAYIYRFSAVAASMQDKLAGAPHASEIPYVFNTLAEARWPMAARDQRLADAMTDYWVAFAKTGAPQAPGRPAWPLADGVHIMAFTDNGAEPGVDDRTERLTALGRIADPHS